MMVHVTVEPSLAYLVSSSFCDTASLCWLQMGGMGFLHYNMKAEEQVQQAKRVKQHVPGFVTRPATLAPQSTVADFESLKVPANPPASPPSHSKSRKHISAIFPV